MKIIFINTLNNYSGAPKILSIIIKGMISKGYSTSLITSFGPGFLSNIDSLKYFNNGYRYSTSKLQTFAFWIWAQIKMFYRILGMSRKNIYYINTITPIGAVWACWITRKNIIYHVHEDMQMQKPFYHIYRLTYRICNKKSIFVSHYLKSRAIGCNDGLVVYNSLDQNFIVEATHKYTTANKTNILFVGSLRLFKGIYEFIELGRRFSQYHFTMVVSATSEEVEKFIQESKPTSNVTILPIQTNLHPFYSKARIVLQLSHPDKWVETFGLTILEAMTYGIPVIAPNAGGPKELVEHGITGFLVDPTNIEEICHYIELLMTNDSMYNLMSRAALNKSKLFDSEKMVDQIEKYIQKTN